MQRTGWQSNASVCTSLRCDRAIWIQEDAFCRTAYVGTILLVISYIFLGSVAISLVYWYRDCDPLLAGLITKVEQVRTGHDDWKHFNTTLFSHILCNDLFKGFLLGNVKLKPVGHKIGMQQADSRKKKTLTSTAKDLMWSTEYRPLVTTGNEIIHWHHLSCSTGVLHIGVIL